MPTNPLTTLGLGTTQYSTPTTLNPTPSPLVNSPLNPNPGGAPYPSPSMFATMTPLPPPTQAAIPVSAINTGVNALMNNVTNPPYINPATVPQITTLPPPPTPTAGVATPTYVNPSQVPGVQAPQVQAAQAGFQNFDQLQQSIYHTTYDPIAQEIAHQQQLQNEQLAGDLARKGLSTSGVGIQATQDLNNEFTRQFIDQSRNASYQASAQRYGLEYAQSLDNAKLQQEANLANAGFSLQAQIATTNNVMQALLQNSQLGTQTSLQNANNATQASIAGSQLGLAYNQLVQQGQIQNVENYFTAMGLNIQSGLAIADDFLQLLGIYEQDLARLDQYDLQTLSLFLTGYLGELGILGGAGQVTQGRSESPTG